MRLLYFVYFAGNGIFFTYINVYYRDLGLSGTQIGVINTLCPLAGILGLTTFGVLNDRFGRTRFFLMIAIAGGTCTALAIRAAPGFAWIVPIASLVTFLVNPIVPLLDTTTITLLGDRRQHYGRYRLWGSVGFMATAAVIGTLLERYGTSSMFVFYGLVMGVLLVSAAGLPTRNIHLGGFTVRGLERMLSQPAWLIFAVSIFCLGLSFSGIASFLSVSLRVMGASDRLIGLAWMTAAVPEIPVMLLGPFLLRRVGVQRLLLVAFGLYALRNILYAVMPTPVWVIPAHLVLGAAYGLYWISAVNYVAELAPPGLRTTSQSLVTATTSLANVIGALFSGWLFDRLGPSGMFSTLALFSVLALMMLLIGRRAAGQPVAATAATSSETARCTGNRGRRPAKTPDVAFTPKG
jgi:MFS transporter, PPP family, 3-phenylpropionic acid transporter